MGNDQPCEIEGIGTVKISMFDGVARTLHNVRFIPRIRKNLISLGVLDSRGYQCVIGGGSIDVVTGKGQILIRAQKQSKNLYILQGNTIQGTALAISSQEEVTQLWHNRLGHMSEKGLKKLLQQNLLPGLKSSKLEFCEHCVYGKHKRSSFGVGKHNSKEILVYVHSDVWGKSPVPSHSGKEYYVSFVDDCTRYVWIYFMHLKSEVFSIFLKWKAQVESQTGKKVKCLRSDNGGEYVSKAMVAYFEKEGITHHFTTSYTPEQNGVAERLNRTLLERARSMLSYAGLSQTF